MRTELKRTMRLVNGIVSFTALVASLCLAGPAAQAGPLLQSYFPLQNGDQKTFTATVDSTPVQQTQIFTNVMFNGNDTFAGAAMDTWYGGSGATSYLNYSGDQLLWYGSWLAACGYCSDNGATLTFDPPVVLLDEQSLAKGGTHSLSGTGTVTGHGLGAMAFPFTCSYLVKSAGNLTVPAGTFSNCMELVVKAAIKTGKGTRTLTVTDVILAPDVGVIQEPIGFPYKTPSQVGLYQLSQWSPVLPYTYTTNSGAITIEEFDCSSSEVTIRDSIGGLPVTGIGPEAFSGCTNLTSVTIPANVIGIGSNAFYGCTGLTAVYFEGNAPTLDGSNVFATATGYDPATVYYLSSATGFGSTFGGLPTALLNPCTYKLSATSVKFASKGGPETIKVTSHGTNCTWTTVSSNSFITVTSGASGTNNASVVLGIAANPDAVARTGTVSIAEQTVTIAQAAAKCAFTLATNSASFASTGGSGSVAVTANGGACAWKVVNPQKFVTITSATSFSGDGTVTYTVESNSTTKARTDVMTIGAKKYTITESTAP